MLRDSNSFRRRLTAHALLLVIAGTLMSCGSHPGAMNGTWAFNLISQGTLDELRATASLSQSGDQLSGTVSFVGANGPCAPNTAVAGSITGNSLELQFNNGSDVIALTGTTNSAFTTASGTYLLSGPLCLQVGGPGTWSAVFIAN